MPYTSENEMYGPVREWLNRTLREKYSRCEVRVFDTHNIFLNKFLDRKGIKDIPQYESFEMKIDITGIIKCNKRRHELVFVECKLNRISLRDLSQILGYSKVANPIHSFIISPAGFKDGIIKLLKEFNRYDVLIYYSRRSRVRKVKLIRWNESTNTPDYNNKIPNEELFRR